MYPVPSKYTVCPTVTGVVLTGFEYADDVKNDLVVAIDRLGGVTTEVDTTVIGPDTATPGAFAGVVFPAVARR